MIDQKLGEEACQYFLYGTHLNSLGVACIKQNRAEEAAAYLHQAIKARSAAQDYDTKEELKKAIAMSKSALQDAKEMI